MIVPAAGAMNDEPPPAAILPRVIGPEAGVLKAAAPASIMGPNIMTPIAELAPGMENEALAADASAPRLTFPADELANDAVAPGVPCRSRMIEPLALVVKEPAPVEPVHPRRITPEPVEPGVNWLVVPMQPRMLDPLEIAWNEPELVAASAHRFTAPEQDEEAGAPLESGTNGACWT